MDVELAALLVCALLTAGHRRVLQQLPASLCWDPFLLTLSEAHLVVVPLLSLVLGCGRGVGQTECGTQFTSVYIQQPTLLGHPKTPPKPAGVLALYNVGKSKPIVRRWRRRPEKAFTSSSTFSKFAVSLFCPYGRSCPDDHVLTATPAVSAFHLIRLRIV